MLFFRRFFFLFGLFLGFILFSLSLYGQTHGFATNGDVQIHYRDYGSGMPIVLLSGGPGQSSDGLLPIVDQLKDRYRLILVDQRGTGKSTLERFDSTTITLDHYVEDINQVRKHLGLDDWVVMGHSWGGGLAMAVTAKYPEHTARLIVIGSLGIDVSCFDYVWDNLHYSQEDLDHFAFWSDPAVIAKHPQRAIYEKYRGLLPSRVYDRSAIRDILNNFVVEPYSQEIAALMFPHLLAIQYDFKPQLSTFQKPALIMQGRQGFLGGWTAFTILQTLPNCEIAFIEKCGHFPFIERQEEFYRALEGFLGER